MREEKQRKKSLGLFDSNLNLEMGWRKANFSLLGRQENRIESKSKGLQNCIGDLLAELLEVVAQLCYGFIMILETETGAKCSIGLEINLLYHLLSYHCLHFPITAGISRIGPTSLKSA